MRTWPRHAATALLLSSVAAATGAAQETYPSVRAAPSVTDRVGEPGIVERTEGPPDAPGRPDRPAGTNEVPDRAPLRGEAGEATGFQDRTGASRGIARSPSGEATGTVAPDRSGGGVVRSPSGEAQGIVPAQPSERGMGELPRR